MYDFIGASTVVSILAALWLVLGYDYPLVAAGIIALWLVCSTALIMVNMLFIQRKRPAKRRTIVR